MNTNSSSLTPGLRRELNAPLTRVSTFTPASLDLVNNPWIGLKGMARQEMLARRNYAIRHRVVNIQRHLTSVQTIETICFETYINSESLDAMPAGLGPAEVELYYFYLNTPTKQEVWQEYAARWLMPDPQAQVADNQANLEFSHDHPNATQWKDRQGNWSYLIFAYFFYQFTAGVGRGNENWKGPWWFAGVPIEIYGNYAAP